MQFLAVPPDRMMEVLMGDGWKIYASGLIDENAGQRLEELIRRNNIPASSSIYFRRVEVCPGNEAGKAIRRHLLTDVGQLAPANADEHREPVNAIAHVPWRFLVVSIGFYEMVRPMGFIGFWEKSQGTTSNTQIV